MKYIKTFENFSENINADIVEEGIIGDTIGKVAGKVGDAVEKFAYSWDSKEMINWAKTKGTAYVQSGKIAQDIYDKAKAANFDPKNPESKPYLLACAKLKGQTMSAGGHKA